jgi:hypothetical protein
MRRKLLIGVLIAAVLAVLLSPLLEPPALDTGAYLQAVTGRQAVVCIVTPSPEACGLVVRSGTETVAEVAAGEPRVRHELRVSNLVPGTRYAYTVVDSDGATVDDGTFVTRSEDDARPVRFAVTGDTGGQPWWVELDRSPLLHLLQAYRWLPVEDEPRAVAALLLELQPDFWVHTGDVVYPRGEARHYQTGFFTPFAALNHVAPCYPILGNHDVMTEDGAPFLTNFVLPGENERNFTFREGPVRFVGLDLNHEVGPNDPAMAFLREVATTSSEPWLIVYNHFPVRSAYRETPRRDLEQHFLPLCEELGVDLMFAGHDHNYQRFGQPGGTIQVVTGGGGKSLYEIRYPSDDLVAAASEYHACLVEVEGAVLRLTARSIDGDDLDHFEIDKGAQLRDGSVRGNAQRLARLQALVQ